MVYVYKYIYIYEVVKRGIRRRQINGNIGYLGHWENQGEEAIYIKL